WPLWHRIAGGNPHHLIRQLHGTGDLDANTETNYPAARFVRDDHLCGCCVDMAERVGARKRDGQERGHLDCEGVREVEPRPWAVPSLKIGPHGVGLAVCRPREWS